MSKRSLKGLKAKAEKNASSYVLITCGQPSEEGEMQVEMTYQGDEALVSYLLQGAQLLMDAREDDHTCFSSAS